MTNYWDNDTAQSLTGGLVLAIVGVLIVWLMAEDPSIGGTPLFATATLFALNLAAYLVFISTWGGARRSRQLIALWLQAACIAALYVLVDMSFVAILGIVWIVQAMDLFNIRTITWLLIASISVFSATQMYHWLDRNAQMAIISAITLSLFHLFAVIATQRAVRESELREETAALNRELIATRELLSQNSRQHERLRIARDLHDLLGHHLTALILQLEVARHVSEGAGRDKVDQALALGKLLLSDLRTAVSELRDDDAINLQEAVGRLISDIPNLQVELNFGGAPVVRDITVAETLLRCTQEALTNVLRHSNATHCKIALTDLYNQYFLTVKDNGSNHESITPGNGLKGMMERAREAGGEVSWQCDENGFVLQVTLPAEVES